MLFHVCRKHRALHTSVGERALVKAREEDSAVILRREIPRAIKGLMDPWSKLKVPLGCSNLCSAATAPFMVIAARNTGLQPSSPSLCQHLKHPV